MFEKYDDIMELEQVCEALKIGRNTLYTLLKEEKIKALRIGRIWKIPKINLIKFVEENSGNYRDDDEILHEPIEWK